MRFPALFLATLLTGAAAPPPADGSLEELLRRARERAAELQRELAPRVERVVQSLEGLSEPVDPALLAALHDEVDRMGSAAAPLLVPWIDPGATPTEATLRRAAEVRAALERLDTSAVTDRLLALSRGASATGQAHAALLLGRAPAHDAAARARLEELFAGPDRPLRRAAARALARARWPGRGAFFALALADTDPELVGAVLAVLAEEPSPEALDPLQRLVAQPARVAPWIDPLVRTLRALAPLAAEHLGPLVELALSPQLGRDERRKLLAALPALSQAWSSDDLRRLARLAEDEDPLLREAALVCLANLGDRGARRELLVIYDDLIEKNERWPTAWQSRGEMWLGIGEPRYAARDFERAIDLIRAQGRHPPVELSILLARAHARDKRLRQAYEALEGVPLSPEERAALAADEDFRALREHPRYGRVLGG